MTASLAKGIKYFSHTQPSTPSYNSIIRTTENITQERGTNQSFSPMYVECVAGLCNTRHVQLFVLRHN